MMNKFTRGEWLTLQPNTGFVYCLNEATGQNQFQFCIQGNGRQGADPKELAANATLCATTGTTATKLAEAGYDAVKVLEMLPLIATTMSQGELETAFELLEQCRGE